MNVSGNTPTACTKVRKRKTRNQDLSLELSQLTLEGSSPIKCAPIIQESNKAKFRVPVAVPKSQPPSPNYHEKLNKIANLIKIILLHSKVPRWNRERTLD